VTRWVLGEQNETICKHDDNIKIGCDHVELNVTRWDLVAIMSPDRQDKKIGI
jgi:hypothetical protein